MHKVAFVLSILLCCSAAGEAQSLTELADREKQRRKENAEAGKTPIAEIEVGPLTAKQRRYVDQQANRKTVSNSVEEIRAEIDELQRMLAETEMEYKIVQSECRTDAHRAKLSPSSDEVGSCRKMRRMSDERRADKQRIRDLKKEIRELPARMKAKQEK